MAGNSKEATIYGAGMSGLIAAVNLAREGYSVTVHDRESGYGGSQLYNPSTHVTPIDPSATSEYIGIDITGVFHQLVRPIPFYFHDAKVGIPAEAFYAVERGDRATSLDTLLYDACKGLDVTFEFNSPLRKEDLPGLAPNTIIACGLTPSAYKMLDVPYLPWYGWISRGELSIGSYAWIWWDECISEYGYLSTVNDYYFDLLFSKREVTREGLRRYNNFMVRHEGIEHDNWEYVSGAVPLASPDNPRLFWGDHILCGTISGAMDPWFWFGISGALVTGKVAALAVYDREKAMEEFERFTRNFRTFYYIKNRFWYPFFRPNVSLNERLINMVGASSADRMSQRLDRQAARGRLKIGLVPGFGRYNYS
jgi:flavin-dependent dehydrogenase